MEILKFSDSPSPNRSNNNRRKPAGMIVAGVLVAMMGMSTTLAGTITIGTNNKVEFGQGVVTTAACDTDGFTLTPSSSYETSTATFKVSAMKLEGINGPSCHGKTFTVSAYDSSKNLITMGAKDTDTARTFFTFSFDSATSNVSRTGVLGAALSASGSNLGTSSGVINITNLSFTNDVLNITVETS